MRRIEKVSYPTSIVKSTVVPLQQVQSNNPKRNPVYKLVDQAPQKTTVENNRIVLSQQTQRVQSSNPYRGRMPKPTIEFNKLIEGQKINPPDFSKNSQGFITQLKKEFTGSKFIHLNDNKQQQILKEQNQSSYDDTKAKYVQNISLTFPRRWLQ